MTAPGFDVDIRLTVRNPRFDGSIPFYTILYYSISQVCFIQWHDAIFGRMTQGTYDEHDACRGDLYWQRYSLGLQYISLFLPCGLKI